MVDTSQSAGLPKAQQLLQQRKASYLVELPERINELEQLVLGLSRTDEFAQRFEERCHKMHSLKGSAGIYGIPMDSAICHQLEEMLNTVKCDAQVGSDGLFKPCCGCAAYRYERGWCRWFAGIAAAADIR